jgi:hypothetical protein
MLKALNKSSNPPVFRRVLLLLAGFSLPAFAFQPLITDDTGTQGRSGNQLEFSANQERTAGDTIRSAPVTYTRGLNESIDVFAGLGYAKIQSTSPGADASGGNNPSLGAKWRFLENDERGTSLAIKPEIVFPVSAENERSGLGSGKTSGKLTLIVSQEFPFGAIHFNAGIGNERYRDSLENPDTTTTRFSLAPVWDISAQWKLAIDLGAQSARAAGTTLRSNHAELGAIYSPGKDLDFALGIVHSSANDTPRTTSNAATAGLTWRFQ